MKANSTTNKNRKEKHTEHTAYVQGKNDQISRVIKMQNIFDIHVTVHHDKFLIIKPTRCTNFSNLFWKETLHVLDNSSVHHEFFTVHTAMVYVIQVCWQLASKPVWHIPLLCVQLASCQHTCMTYTIAVCTMKNSWWWTEELSETCKVSFQYKFEKLVHLIGLIIRKMQNILTNLKPINKIASNFRFHMVR